jgi:hypothetical protein
MTRKRKILFQQSTAMVNGQAQTIFEPIAPGPSALTAAASTSGSVALVGGMFALTYGFDYSLLLPVVAVPWLIYALGKGIYLVVLLSADVAGLFEFGHSKKSSKLLPIAKHEMP